ncbi:uncharacterized protein CTRU02_202064 [Colletotrichum truncatum]|uniref:Uncharacterized protein n=1 Tax=Colletotrichum truncatum TaxID=5467 RepID=A0ACC3ZJ65_COLTU
MQPVPSSLSLRDSTQSSNQLARQSHSQLQSQQPSQLAAGRRRGRPPGSRNRTTLARLTQETASSQAPTSSQRQTRSQVTTLSTSRSTGLRSNGRRLQASIRRTRSQWELLSSSDESLKR